MIDLEQRAMARAFELAARGARTTQPNPRVGCVIVRDGAIVGEGWHQRAGEPHAEVFALREAGERARGATAFVTLEPCNHHGRTPPCTEALIAAGIAEVVFASGDPNPEVDGRGRARLHEAGIRVRQGVMQAEGEQLNRGFFARMRRGRPWLRLKMAASLDGRTALANGASQWITSDAARADVQQWRAESAAILSTAATVLADDPRLDVRLPDSERQPLRVILDSKQRLQGTERVFAPPGEVLHLTGDRALGEVLAELAAVHHINEIWTEAGPTLAGALLAGDWVDELVLYLAPCLLGPDARPLAHLPTLTQLADAQRWTLQDLRQIGPDIRIILTCSPGSSRT
jgi:diaminohydroxyphosphoribosylaminopyrimidine deaminase/5-amino-6-(5-phosphoribosylamino)uracil reductase